MKRMMAAALCLLLLPAAVGCSAGRGEANSEVAADMAVTAAPVGGGDAQEERAQPAPREEGEIVGGDLCPCVRVKGVLYFDTGVQSTALRCGMMDGSITSACAGSEVPAEDGQSNFGTGYGYQYGRTEGTIEIQLDDGNWYIFATDEAKETYKPQ